MIIHVFTGERYHLVPGISKGIAVTYKDQKHFFILTGTPKLEKIKYISLYKSIGFSNYCFCTNKKQLYNMLVIYRGNPVVFHAGSYSDFAIAYLAHCKNVNWVCWGAGASIGKNIKSKVFTPIKSILYRHFKHIVVLMTPDKDTIVRDYGVRNDVISVIPYTSSLAFEMYKISEIERNNSIGVKNKKPRILLGNNPGNIPHYISMLHLLQRFVGEIEIHCMCQYSLVKNEKYYELSELGKSIFKDDFYIDEEFMNKEKYNEYISSFDVYMCGNKNQTGLGAINYCLRHGKKVYITGKNYEWMKGYYDVIVFDIDSIAKMKLSDFVKPLTENEISYNFNSLFSKINVGLSKWTDWYNTIETNESI